MSDYSNMCCDVYVALIDEGCNSVNKTRLNETQTDMEANGLCSTNSTCYSICPQGQYYRPGGCKQ